MTSEHRARLGLLIVCLGSFVAPLDTTVNTAFPVITAAFALPLRDIQWVVIPFVLAQSSFALVFGHLGDRLGHRRVFALGLAASAFAHAAVALSPDFPTLIGTRVLQGAAVGIAVSCAPALATLLFHPADKARVLVWYAAATSLAMAVGPWLGGLLLEAFGWPGVFWFRVPLALVALLLLPMMLPAVSGFQSSQSQSAPQSPPSLPAESIRAPDAAGFDWGGALGLTAVLGCLVLAFAELTAPDRAMSLALPLLLVGAAGAVLFVRHEARVAHPVLRVEPFRSRRFSGIQLASVAVNLACFANLLLLPYVLTRDAGVSIGMAGLLLSAYPGGSMLGSLLAGRLAGSLARRSPSGAGRLPGGSAAVSGGASADARADTRAGVRADAPADLRAGAPAGTPDIPAHGSPSVSVTISPNESPAPRLMAAGLVGAAIGLLLTAAILFAWPAPWLLGACMLASGIGQGVFQVGYMDATTSMLPIEERGVAGSLISVTRLLGLVLGATGIGWLQGVTQSYASSFAVLGSGLALFAALFESLERRQRRCRTFG